MKIGLGIKHFLQGHMADFRPGLGDPMEYARTLFPATFQALDEVKAQWRDRSIAGGDDDDALVITIFVCYDDTNSETKPEQVRRVKGGFTGAINLYREDVGIQGNERSVSEIRQMLDARIQEVVRLVTEVSAK